MPRPTAHAQTAPSVTVPRLTRMTSKNQVTIHKALTDARGLPARSLFQIEDLAEGFLLRPVTVTPDPDRQAYLDAKAGKGLSPVFTTAAEGIAHLRKAVARRRAKK